MISSHIVQEKNVGSWLNRENTYMLMKNLWLEQNCKVKLRKYFHIWALRFERIDGRSCDFRISRVTHFLNFATFRFFFTTIILFYGDSRSIFYILFYEIKMIESNTFDNNRPSLNQALSMYNYWRHTKHIKWKLISKPKYYNSVNLCIVYVKETTL